VNLGIIKEAHLAREPDEGEKDEDGQGGIIVKQPPLVVVQNRELLLDVDPVQGHEAGGAHAVEDSLPGEVDLAIGPHKEASKDDEARDNSVHRGVLSQQHVGEEDVEDNAEGAGDLVKRDLHVLEAEVVEGEHAHIDQRKWDNLFGNFEVELKGRHQGEK